MTEKRTYGPIKSMILRVHSTGLFRDDLPLHDESQPFAVEIGYMLTDEAGNIPDVNSNIVRTEGRVTQAQATAIHGLTAPICDNFGASEIKLIGLFTDLLKVPVYRHLRVITYAEHDRRIISAMIARIGKRVNQNFDKLWEMRPQTEFIALQDPWARVGCKLPDDDGGYRRPTLKEAESLIPHFDREALLGMGLPLSLVEMMGIKEMYLKFVAEGLMESAA